MSNKNKIKNFENKKEATFFSRILDKASVLNVRDKALKMLLITNREMIEFEKKKRNVMINKELIITEDCQNLILYLLEKKELQSKINILSTILAS